MSNDDQYLNNYERIFDGLDNLQVGESLKKLMKDLDKTLERMKKSASEESFDDYGIKRLFQQNDSRMFNMLNKLHKYELLQIFKKQFKLSKKDTKIIDKIVTQNTLNEKELNYISNFIENFREEEIDVIERIVEGHVKHIEIQEENEQRKNDRFNTLRKLCQFDLLDIIGSMKLEKSEIEQIKNITAKDKPNKKELDCVHKLTLKFSAEEFELFKEEIESREVEQKFDILEKRFDKFIKHEYDASEKEQLNQTGKNKNFLKSMASWIKEAFTRVIEKLKSRKYLVEFEGIKKQEGNSKFDVNNEVISESQSLEDLTGFGKEKITTNLNHVEISKTVNEQSREV